MASLTLKHLPDELLARLRAHAERERRSITQQAIRFIEEALAAPRPADATDVEAQVARWRALAGRWQSDRTAAEEIDEIYAARTQGREVEL